MKRTNSFMVLAVLVGSAHFCQAQNYRFKIDPEKTYTDGNLEVRYWTSGKFRGSFDPTSNLNGTRTVPATDPGKPEPTNDWVSCSPIWTFRKNGVFRTSGTFDLSIDLSSMKATVENYKAERLADGPINVSGTCELNNNPFRSIGPDANLAAPVQRFSQDTMVLDRLQISQKTGKRTGTITQLPDGWYRVSVTFMADVLIDVLDLSQSGPLVFTMASSIVGDFKSNGTGADFSYIRGQGGDNLTRDEVVQLEPFDLFVPVSTEQKANVRLMSNIKRVSLGINGIRQFLAVGEQIVKPEPVNVPPAQTH